MSHEPWQVKEVVGMAEIAKPIVEAGYVSSGSRHTMYSALYTPPVCVGEM